MEFGEEAVHADALVGQIFQSAMENQYHFPVSGGEIAVNAGGLEFNLQCFRSRVVPYGFEVA